jgi:hypothetical protein
MIDNLKFEKLNGIELIDLTNNTIVLFSTKESLLEFKNEFEKLIENSNYEFVSFSTDDGKENIDIKKIVICRDISGIYNVNNNEQRFILTIEPISMLTIKDIHDLWFVDKTENGIWYCFAFTSYKDYENYTSNEQIYQFVCESKYGCGVKKE